EGLHPCHTVLGRCSNQGEASNHHTFHHEIHLAERRRGSLPFQNFEEIAVVGLGATVVALVDRTGDLFPHRSPPSTIGVLPGQAILLARSADDALGILVHSVTLVWL